MISSDEIDYEDFIEVCVSTNKADVQVYSMSDIHADTKSNADYIRSIARLDDNCFTIFICNGDLCSDIATLRKSFADLKNIYDEVCFVPGNHELWRRGSEDDQGTLKGKTRYAPTSLSKFNEVVRCAKQSGVRTGPLKVYSACLNVRFHIYPLYSWYHSGFDTEKDLTNDLYLEYREIVPFNMMWMDFRQCQWPSNIVSHEDFCNCKKDSTALAMMFAGINNMYLPCDKESNTIADDSECDNQTKLHVGDTNDALNGDDNDIVISFSHFTPRLELIPEKRFLLEPLLSRASGSHFLENQIRQLNPHVHLTGHTHFPIDMTLEGVRYIQWPLGYDKEQSSNCRGTKRHGPLLLYDSKRISPNHQYTSNFETKGFISQGEESPLFNAHWTKYYRENFRTPEVTHVLSPHLENQVKGIMQLL